MRPIKFKFWDGRLKRIVAWGEVASIFDQTQVFSPEGLMADTDVTPIQFTGQYDDVGNEIYEGDILESIYVSNVEYASGAYIRGVVVFHRSQFLQKFSYNVNGDGNIPSSDNRDFYDTIRRVRIVGNIFENSYLLDY